MKSHFTKKEQIAILIVISIIVTVLGFKFFSKNFITNNDKDKSLLVNLDEPEREDQREDSGKKESEVEEFQPTVDIIVHISGQVKSPGIVEVKSGQRLIDAVELLGGLTEDADGDRINLARKLQDEEKVYIPKIGEEIETELLSIAGLPDETVSSSEDSSDKIDINICTKEELMNLPGIGDVLSGNIISYRDDNIFKAIEDVMNVSGVGTKKFEGIKDLIIVK